MDFVSLLNTMGIKFYYGGFINEWTTDLAVVPANGKVFVVKL